MEVSVRKVGQWRIWPWNWRQKKEVHTSLDACETVEEMIAFVECQKQRASDKKLKKSERFIDSPAALIAFFTLGIGWLGIGISLLLDPKRKEKREITGVGAFVTLIGWAISFMALFVGSWALTGGVLLTSMIGYAIAYMFLGSRTEGDSQHRLKQLDPHEWMKKRIEEAREQTIGPQSDLHRELAQTETEIRTLENEQSLWESRQKEGSCAADEALIAITIGLAQLREHKKHIEARMEKVRAVLAAGQARIEANIPLFREREMLKSTMEKIPDSQELHDRLMAVDAKLKRTLREQFGMVEHALRKIELLTQAIPHEISSEEIRRRAALTVPHDIAFENAMDELQAQMVDVPTETA